VSSEADALARLITYAKTAPNNNNKTKEEKKSFAAAYVPPHMRGIFGIKHAFITFPNIFTSFVYIFFFFKKSIEN
jgi:hypothetical protein